jgi:hypothetical protein
MGFALCAIFSEGIYIFPFILNKSIAEKMAWVLSLFLFFY